MSSLPVQQKRYYATELLIIFMIHYKRLYVNALKEHFHPVTPLQVCYNLQLEDGRILSLDIDNDKLTCSNKENPAANVQIRIGRQTVKQLMNGEITMHNAFLSGAASAKGDFKQIRTFDTVFPFRQP